MLRLRTITVNCFILLSGVQFVFILIWLDFMTLWRQPAIIENLFFKYGAAHKKANDFEIPDDMKYILLWNTENYAPLKYFGLGQRVFLQNECSVIKCYVTPDRQFFGGDLTKFEAVAFNGHILNEFDLPSERSDHQKYIFFTMESAAYYPVCQSIFDGFFNWTSTYRLDSDIPSPYLLIRDNNGVTVGPKRKMQWEKDITLTIDDQFAKKIKNKTHAAAWFVSRCKTMSGRLDYVKKLKKALKRYKLKVDIYGRCGKLECPRTKSSLCNILLKYDYFFYMSMENSFAKDYVTEKLLTALQNDVVPIVYGGADYTRFLPPGSYIDGRKHNVTELAAMMNRLMHSPKEYSQYFWWKQHYSYHHSTVENVCAVCEALHDEKVLQKTTIYENFRTWWNTKPCR